MSSSPNPRPETRDLSESDNPARPSAPKKFIESGTVLVAIIGSFHLPPADLHLRRRERDKLPHDNYRHRSRTNRGEGVIFILEKQLATENRPFRILLIDDHPIILQGLTQILNQESGLMVCGTALNADAALNAIEETRPDLAIVEIFLKATSGLDLIKIIREKHPEMPVLVLSMHDESYYAERVIRAGATGYIMKEEPTEKLLEAIYRVLEGKIYVSTKMSSKLLAQLIGQSFEKSSSAVERLSNRELEVFYLIGQGCTTRDIGTRLSLSVKTVESHRERIKEKLGLRRANELLLRAFNWVHRGDDR